MDLYQEAETLTDSLSVPFASAINLAYLRHRSRWSFSLEQRLIAAAQAGLIITCDGEESKILGQFGF